MTIKMRDADSMESRHITPAAGRTRVELRSAALTLAGLALDLPEDERESTLTEVLQILGYRTRTPVTSGPDFRTDALGRIDRHHREAVRKKRRYEQGETEVTATPIQGYSVRRHGLESVCGVDVGTLKGYNRHITAYNTACSPCVRAHQDALDERWARLGIPSHAREQVSRW